MATNVELRRSNGTNYNEVIHLKTSVALVEGLLDGNDKIKASLLPSFVFGSMRFVATIDEDTDLATIHSYFNTFVTNNGGSIRGCYAIIGSGPSFITISEGYEIWGEEGAGTSETSGQVAIEVNDWLICISDDGKTWAIINNTYRDATTTTKGIVKLATEQDGIDGTSGPLAMTPKATAAAINEILGDIDTALSNILGV